MAAAALHAAEHDPDTLLLILPADHLIHDPAAFAKAVQRAAALAADGRLVTFGITPETPETGYGYIEADGHMVKRFVEKPDTETAKAYLEAGNFYWNAGMFCFRAETMVDELRQHAPDILEAVAQGMRDARRAQGPGYEHVEFTPQSFLQVREDSIDYAVMEKSRQVAVVPCSIGWSDIGSWTALTDLQPADEHGNRVRGETLLHDVSHCAIHAEHDRLVGAVGVSNLVIVDTPDALLVAARDRVQDVKALYTQLKRQAHPAHKLHRTVHRPWGTYTVLEEGPHFKIKRIVVKPGASLSLQMHHHRSEHWIVVFGTAHVVSGERENYVPSNESTFIPPCTSHRLSNPGLVDLVLIEVQTGHYLGEDDIVRLQDAYGRTDPASASLPTNPTSPAARPVTTATQL